jgi:hypothetical protein
MTDILIAVAISLLIGAATILRLLRIETRTKSAINQWMNEQGFRAQGTRRCRFARVLFDVYEFWGFDRDGQWRSGQLLIRHMDALRGRIQVQVEWHNAA